jgi:HlyD family secretion protein
MKYFISVLIAVTVIIITIAGFYFFRKQETQGVLTLYGNVDVRQVDISFRVDGRVETMPFEEGDFVPTGALMGTLELQPYEDKVEETKATIESLQSQLSNANDMFKRREELVGEGGVSKEDCENALNSRDVYAAQLKESEAAFRVALKNLHDTRVFSPSDGVILTRVREPGSVVKEGDPIYTLSLNSPIWVRAFVNEPHLGNIYPGMPAEVYTDTKTAPSYQGHIGFISPVAEFTPKTVETLDLRTDLVYRLRIIVDNPDWRLKQGMPVTVKLYPEKRGSNGRRISADQ